MKKELCVPCAIKLSETKNVVKSGNRKDKFTCALCGRRRYGNEYSVTSKIRKD